MMTDYLKNWCINHNALNRTKEMFWNCFDHYSKEEYEEFKSVFTHEKNDVQIKFDEIALENDLPDFTQELISVTIDIYICEEQVAWYKQLFMLNGELFDKHFELY